MRHRPQSRPGITLLEMVLTFAIAMTVLLALFVVMRTQFSTAQAGRDALAESTLARGILARISSDIVNSLGPVDPRFLPKNILPNNANQPASNNSSAAPAPSTGTAAVSDSSTTPVPYNLGVKGDETWLVLSTNRVPGALLVNRRAPLSDDAAVSSDLRSLSFWLVEGAGLARNEMSYVTSDAAPLDEPSFDNAEQFVIAREVLRIRFQYFDGVDWLPSWDGGQLGGDDGNTPIGPPRAIAITIWLRSGVAVDGVEPPEIAYKHVVALPASNAFTQSGEGLQTSGNLLIPSLQTGEPIPAANQETTTDSSAPK